MSYDCEYLLAWENQRFIIDDKEVGNPPILAIEDILTAQETSGFYLEENPFIVMPNALYIHQCAKHGIDFRTIKFRIHPDQIFERGNGGYFKEIKQV